MSDYTPTTDEVRYAYADYNYPPGSGSYAEGVREVDRWVAAHDREVAARALRGFAGVVASIAALGRHNSGLRTPEHLAEYASNYADRIERGEDV